MTWVLHHDWCDTDVKCSRTDSIEPYKVHSVNCHVIQWKIQESPAMIKNDFLNRPELITWLALVWPSVQFEGFCPLSSVQVNTSLGKKRSGGDDYCNIYCQQRKDEALQTLNGTVLIRVARTPHFLHYQVPYLAETIDLGHSINFLKYSDVGENKNCRMVSTSVKMCGFNFDDLNNNFNDRHSGAIWKQLIG